MVDFGKILQFDELRTLNENCMLCEIAKDRKNVVFGEGSPFASLFLIGEAPAKEEDKQGKPFVGLAGKLLDEILLESGFDRKELFITSCLKCKTPRNREPTKDELWRCRIWLKQQLEIIKPDITVLLGAIALKNLLNLTGVSGKHGKLIKEGNNVYFVSFHPAVALYKPKFKKVLIEDFKRLKKMLDSHYKFIKGSKPLESVNISTMGVDLLPKKKTKKKVEKKKDENNNSKTNWIRVANIDRYTGAFKPNQKHKEEFEGAEIQFNIRDVIAFLDGKKDWILLGSDSLSGKEEGKNGIFLNLSQNKRALTFAIDRQLAEEPKEIVWYNIPIKAITEFGGQWIGVFRTGEEPEEKKEEKKK